MKKKLINCLTWLIIIVAMGVLSIIIFWLSYPYKTINIEDFQTTQAEYHPGDTIVYTFEYTKCCNHSAIMYRQLNDKVMYQLDYSRSNLPVAENKVVSSTVIIPLGIASDIYTLQITEVIRVNPIREITKEFISKPFTIK